MNNKKPQHPARSGRRDTTISRAERRRRMKAAKRRKFLLTASAAVLVAAGLMAVLLFCGDKSDPAVTPVPAATTEATIEATAEPTSEPEATYEAEITAEPVSETTVEPTAEPVAEPTSEPTSEPVAATEEPTSEPTVEPAAELPAELLTETDLSAIYEGGVRVTGEVASEIMPYQIYVSKDSYTIAILGVDDNGEHTRLLRTWRTAIGTGNKTRAGSYKIDKQYLWYEWSLGGFTPYTSRLDGAKIRLHAPLHNQNGVWDSLWKEGYTQIGTQETQGCLRTTTEGAAWVYFNCSVGTEVLIANDSMYTSEEPPALGDSESDPTRPVSVDDLEIPVTFFTVDSDSIAIAAGQTHQLTVGGVIPEYEDIPHTFKYVSGNENVVTVNEDGLITAVNPGSAQLLVMADDINKAYRIIEVTVE